MEKGPKYGYFAKPSKCILVTKPERVAKAQEIFKGTDVCVQTEGAKDSGVEINIEGTRHLGAAIGTKDFKATYVQKKIDGWSTSISKLSMIAASQPHAAFATFTHCMQSQWNFLARSMPDLAELFVKLEEVILMDFLPALLRRDLSPLERDVLSLPARLGGLGIPKPNVECVNAHENSVKLSTPLIRLVLRQEKHLNPEDLRMEIFHGRNQIEQETEKLQKMKREQILERAKPELKLAMKTTIEKGASSWVTSSALHEHRTVLHK